MPATSTIVDDFNDGTFNTSLWSGSFGVSVESGGRVRVPCNTGFSGLKTANSYTFDSAYLQVFAPAASGAGECYVDMILSSAGQPGGTDVLIHLDMVANTISARSRTGYFDGSASSATYNATNHRWLRMRISGGNTLFEASPDSRTWSTLRTMATPAWLSAATDVSVAVESHRDAGTDDYAEVDNVNLPGGTLFTTQTPSVTNASDGTPGITTATTVRFLAAGVVTGVRFFATTTVGGTYTARLYQVTAADTSPAGTQLATKTMGVAPTGGAWNTVTFDTPVSVTTGTLYRACLFNSDGRYVATTAFFTGALVNGDVIGDSNGDNPVGLGTLNQGVFAINASPQYPSTVASAASYFVDVEYALESGDRTTAPGGVSVPVALGAPSATFASTAAQPGGLAVPVVLGAPSVSNAGSVAPGGVSAPVALGAPSVSFTATATPTGINCPVLLGAPSATFASTAAQPGGVASPVLLGAPLAAGAATAPGGIQVLVLLGSPRVETTADTSGGSWMGYAAVLASARADARVNAERRRHPVECPVDGWPLRNTRHGMYCEFGGHIVAPS